MFWLSLGLFALYVVFIAACAVGVKRMAFKYPQGQARAVSIVVACRNEETHLRACVASILTSLEHAGVEGELILVDDHSTDATLATLKAFPPESYILVHAKGTGKKNALLEGVAVARHETILLTDADTVVSPHWVRVMATGRGLTAGWVKWTSTSFWGGVWRAEGLAIGWVTAASFGWDWPIAVNGANLAMPAHLAKRPFQGQRSSGDDVQRLRLALQEGMPVDYVPPSKAWVETQVPETLQGGLQQRARWASKNAEVGHRPGQQAGMMLLAGNLSWPLLLLIDPTMGLLLLLAKCLIDAAVVAHAARMEQSRVPWIPFLVLEAVYPVYLVWMALVAPFFSYEWKGRKMR